VQSYTICCLRPLGRPWTRLVDNTQLSQSFREHFLDGLRRLICRGELRLEGQWWPLQDPPQREAWFAKLTATDWNVFVEGPPNGQSRPIDVLKYLARYMTGGPISDRRLISDEDGVIRFWARSKDKARGRKLEAFPLKGAEFVRRWTMHILPKGYTRSRSYGGYHSTKRAAYLEACRQLLGIAENVPEKVTKDVPQSSEARPQDTSVSSDVGPEDAQPSGPKCPHCEIAMECVREHSRPSWKQVFERDIYADPSLYSPMFHICQRAPLAYPIDEYG
jgi:hypothetical protein